MAGEQKKGDASFNRLKADLDKLSTVEGFEKRLLVCEGIYAYTIKRFLEKFPAEGKAWVESEDVVWPE